MNVTRTALQVPPPTGAPIVFYAPHQDDETLFMGHAIAHHALVGREVHVVLASDGSTSGGLEAINGLTVSSWWGGPHDPAQEGYAALDEPALAAARDREFVAACGQLGAWPGNIHLDPLRTPVLTVAEAEALILRWAEAIPGAGHYTMWWGDPQAQHAALGQALLNLHQAGDPTFGFPRWLVKPEQAVAAGAAAYNVPSHYDVATAGMVRRARHAYESWQPAHGVFAAGGHSVGLTYFAALPAEPNWIVRVP